MDTEVLITAVIEWLTKYEIIFTTIAAVGLSIMAIIVSIAQNQTAKRQTELMDRQGKLMEKQTELSNMQLIVEKKLASPQIYPALIQVRDAETNEVVVENIHVDNKGKDAYNIYCETAVFLNFFEIPYSRKSLFNMKDLCLPLKGYRFWHLRQNATTGELVILKGNPDSFEKLCKLINSFNSVMNEKGYKGFFNVEYYLKVKYYDIFNDMHFEYFDVAELGRSTKLEASTGEKFLSRYENAPLEITLDISEEISTDLLERLAEINWYPLMY